METVTKLLERRSKILALRNIANAELIDIERQLSAAQSKTSKTKSVKISAIEAAFVERIFSRKHYRKESIKSV